MFETVNFGLIPDKHQQFVKSSVMVVGRNTSTNPTSQNIDESIILDSFI